MKKLILVMSSFLMTAFYLTAEDGSTASNGSGWSSFLMIDVNNYYPLASMKDHIAVRQNVNTHYSSQYYSGSVSSDSWGLSGGLQWFLYHPKLRLGVSTGLRYTGYTTEISGYSSFNSDFFYLRYSEIDQETRFARVKSITEKQDYIGIPIEITYIPFQYDQLSFLTRLGCETGVISIRHKTDISFRESAMNQYKESILPTLGKPAEKPLSKVYWSLGAMYTLKNDVSFRLEGIVRSKYLNGDPFVLSKADYASGLMMAIQIPVMRK